MSTYNNALLIKDALQLYFSKYHFANGGYDLKWFKIKIGPIYIPLPNTKGRIAAVKLHDIHHLITEYKANIKGEAEIGGWEIGAGCGKYIEAWVLNSGSFFYGLFIYPKSLLKAFLRGKRSVNNLYLGTVYNDDLLNKTLGELRNTIEPNLTKPNKRINYLHFVLYSIFVVISTFLFYYGIYLIIKWIVSLL